MTRRQRSRKHERRVHHNRTQRARLRAALRSLPVVASMAEMRRIMGESGYTEGAIPGSWRRDFEPPPEVRSAQAKMTWDGIKQKRLFKTRRRSR